MTFVDFDIRHRNTSLRALYSVILTNCLEVTIQDCYISQTVRTCAKNVWETFVNFLLLPSNGVITKIALRDLDLPLEGQRLESRPFHSGMQPFRCDMYE